MTPADTALDRLFQERPELVAVHLDVRGDIARGAAPFPRIMAAVGRLAADHVLVLRAPFEPLPLYEVLGERGFDHVTRRLAPDDWSVAFYRGPGAGRASAPPAVGAPLVLDVRGLEPPLPMVRVLEEAARLAPGAELEVRHERRPVFLYPHLDARGLAHQTDEPAPGLVRIRIWKQQE